MDFFFLTLGTDKREAEGRSSIIKSMVKKVGNKSKKRDGKLGRSPCCFGQLFVLKKSGRENKNDRKKEGAGDLKWAKLKTVGPQTSPALLLGFSRSC